MKNQSRIRRPICCLATSLVLSQYSALAQGSSDYSSGGQSPIPGNSPPNTSSRVTSRSAPAPGISAPAPSSSAPTPGISAPAPTNSAAISNPLQAPVPSSGAPAPTTISAQARSLDLSGTKPATLSNLNRAAKLKLDGHYGEAEPLLKALLVQEKGDLHESLLKELTLNLLAGVYLHTDRVADALKMYEQCMPLVKANHGAQSLDYATLLDNTAQSYLSLKQLEKAQALQVESIRVYESINPVGIDLAQAYANIALTYREEHKLQDCVAAQKKASELYFKVLPPGDRRVAVNFDNIGITLSDCGNDAEAERYHRKALELLEPLGAHPDVAIAMDNLAMSLAAQHKYDEALSMLDKELKVWTSLYGANSRRALECIVKRNQLVARSRPQA